MSPNFPETQYEYLVRKIFGPQWRNSETKDIDGVMGVLVVKSISDGVNINIDDVSAHLGIHKDFLFKPFTNLDLNGVFNQSRIYKDRKALKSEDQTAWGYYAGYASGDTGPILIKN